MTPQVRLFQPGDETAFRELNEEWIRQYFAIEEKDAELLADPKGTILDPGGSIFLAELEGTPVGCCALIATGPGDYELAKMAVTGQWRGAGIGRQLLAFAIDHARWLGAARLHLETNRKLAPAIRLYESMGFQHIPEQMVPPSPYVRADVFMEYRF